MGFLQWFALVALAEMATFFLVSSRIGLGPAILIALSTAFIGAYLVRRAGVGVWRRTRDRLKDREVPGRELVAGASVLVAGAFLISPGFITDVAGFTLLIPGVQERLYTVARDRFSTRFGVFRADEAGMTGMRHEDWGWEETDIIEIGEVE